MTILPIVVTGDPVLHNPTRPVDEINDDVRVLVADMIETMHAAPGVGLAATQVGVDLQIFVWAFDGSSPYDRFMRSKLGARVPSKPSFGVAINPRLELLSTREEGLDRDLEREGCLSVPDLDYPLRRADEVRLTAMNLDGEEFTIEAKGWLARIFQHEYDHLQGTLYVDRLAEPYATVAQRTIEKEGWGVPGLAWLPELEDDADDAVEDDTSVEN